MHQRLIATGLLLLGLVAACGEGAKELVAAPDQTSSTAGASWPRGPLTPAQMGAGLLRLDDLPVGWQEITAPRETDALPAVEDPTCQAYLETLNGGHEAVGESWVTFAPSDEAGAELEMEIATYGDAEPARRVERLGTFTEECPQVTRTEGGARTVLTVRDLELAVVGDDSVAFQVDIAAESGTLQGLFQVVAVGQNAVYFSAVAPDPMPLAEFTSYVRAGMDRFAAVT